MDDEILEQEEQVGRPSSPPTTDMVLAKYWPGEWTLPGPPAVILDLHEAADSLAESGFMKAWIAAKIRESLLSGESFYNIKRLTPSWKGRMDGMVSQYRMATKDEVINVAETNKFSEVTGRRLSKKSMERGFILHYLDSDGTRDAYQGLPRQAKVILDVLSETDREVLSEAAIEILLTDKVDQLRTKQPPMKIFAFYRRDLVEKGFLEETGQ